MPTVRLVLDEDQTKLLAELDLQSIPLLGDVVIADEHRYEVVQRVFRGGGDVQLVVSES